ncbi:hypothetical protein DPMN_119994 [Dreissena polymorpha]|uniref:Uncharacterized protein n=1 Tax=Dreissena polymorpha TaxID=45954 RepID=A0A9D4GJ44_DREPO|nr:hypothetical protein DPMN_119994 [Dreissena polymorpha]
MKKRSERERERERERAQSASESKRGARHDKSNALPDINFPLPVSRHREIATPDLTLSLLARSLFLSLSLNSLPLS